MSREEQAFKEIKEVLERYNIDFKDLKLKTLEGILSFQDYRKLEYVYHLVTKI